MRTALFEPFAGIAGDMTVAAFLDLGMPFAVLEDALSALPMSGYRISAARTKRGAFAATRFVVDMDEKHPHRHLSDVRTIVTAGSLGARVVERVLGAFAGLAEAEGRVHDCPPDEIHFHEVGAVDAIVDIVGAAVGLEHFGVERVVTGPVRLGTGEVVCRHGRIPVPAPATLHLLRGFPSVYADGEGETATPTGAALLRAWAEPLPREFGFVPEATGYGAGSRDDTPLPNVLRVSIGESGPGRDARDVVEIAANLDDMAPEAVAFALERLLAAGALDAWAEPVVMKKGRAAVKVCCLCEPAEIAALERVLFEETTTLGVRRTAMTRTCLPRRHETVETQFGPVRVKVGSMAGEDVVRSPEYEDCARLAREKSVPFRTVYDAAKASRPSLA